MAQHKGAVAILLTGMVAGSVIVSPTAAHVGTRLQVLRSNSIQSVSTELFSKKAEARSLSAPNDLGSYCARSAANPSSYPSGPCTTVRRLNVAQGYGIIPSLSMTLG